MNILKRTGRLTLLTIVIISWYNQKLFAQNQDSTGKALLAFDVSVTTKNKHLWRGYTVANVPVFTGNATLTTRDKNLQVGLWDGTGYNGEYREFCFFVNYHIKNFEINILDSYNYTGFPDASPFDYKRSSTRHFIDVNLIYHFNNSFPLTASVATVVQGRDTYTNSKGKLSNRYSHYAELDYKIYEAKDLNVHLYLGGAFSFATRETFYSSSASIVNTGIIVNKKIHIGRYTLPVFAQGMWNPNGKRSTLGLGIQLF
jgi:hypothetical protein